jgi:hypothetical protein
VEDANEDFQAIQDAVNSKVVLDHFLSLKTLLAKAGMLHTAE